jgi:hypothetical protein
MNEHAISIFKRAAEGTAPKEPTAFQCNFPCDTRSSLIGGPTTLAVCASTPRRDLRAGERPEKLTGLLPTVILNTSASAMALPRPFVAADPTSLLLSTSLMPLCLGYVRNWTLK